MILGLRYWILIWYGLLLLGIVGLLAALYWARQTRGRNLDEILRAVGTIAVSIGMLLLLYGIDGGVAQTLLLVALGSFIGAVAVGRRQSKQPAGEELDDDDGG